MRFPQNGPDQLAHRLKERAAVDHSTLQGELMAILKSVEPRPRRPQAVGIF
jgi:hypothetical protein